MEDQVRQTIAALEARIAALEQARAVVALLPAPPIIERPLPTTTGDPGELETKLGTYWLGRVGILSLITGIALLVITHFDKLGAALRIGLGYGIAGALAWLGLRLAKKHATLGQVVFGGGLAIAYFVTYALHFVTAMRVVESQALGITLVALAIAGLVACAHRMRSETVAGIALFLGLHTGMLSEVTTLALVCSSMLAVGAAFLFVANRWVIVPLSTVAAAHTTLAMLAFGAHPPSAAILVAFASVVFVVFAIAIVVRAADVATRSLFALGAVAWFGTSAIGAAVLERSGHHAMFAFLCAVAAAQLTLATVCWLRKAAGELVALQTVLAIVTLAIALPTKFTGGALVLGWLVLGVGVGLASRRAGWLAWVGLGLLGLAHAAMQASDLGLAWHAPGLAALVIVERGHAASDRGGAVRLVAIIGVALALLRIAELAMPSAFHTIAWTLVAFALFAAGFVLRDRVYRWSAFGTLGLAALRLLGTDLAFLSANERILTFVGAGAVLLVVSYGYARRAKSTG